MRIPPSSEIGLRDAKKDLLDLLETVEKAIREGAIDIERDPGRRLWDSLVILRRWWP